MDIQKHDKPFMTYEQQIHKLKNEKKLEIADESYALKLLKEYSYFALISGYKNPFKANERLYNYRYNKGSIDDTYVHSALKIPLKKIHYKKGKNDLFAVVIVLKYLLEEDVFSDFIDELDVTITTLLNNIKILQQTQLYKYMGFPENWKDIKTCKRAE